MNCGASINVSVDPTNCEAEITPEMYGAQADDCAGLYVIVYDKHNEPILDNIVTSEHIGQTLQVELHSDDNLCWGYITVEDYAKPVIDCPTDPIEVECGNIEDYTPTATDNCGTPTVVATLLSVVNNNCNMGLPDNVLRVVTKRFVATDAYGNQSDECVVTINVVTSTATIDYPENYVYLEGTNLNCDDNFNTDANGHPSPVADGSKFGTGVPTLGVDGPALYPTPYDVCGLMSNYSDINLGTSNCVTKIMRTWTVTSWNCEVSGILETQPQIIEIADTLAPTFNLVDEATVSTQGHNCMGLYTLPQPTNVTDNCGDIGNITVSNLDNDPYVENLTNGTTTIELPAGENKLYYDIYDSCGNVRRDSVLVTVVDNTPPVAVCIQNSVVSLTSDGSAWLAAQAVDNGSYDECQLKTVLVRRMNTSCDCEIPEFNHLTYKGTYNGKYYYLSDHKFTYDYAVKHITALDGTFTNYAVASSATKTWLNENVFDTNNDDTVDESDEGIHTLNNAYCDPALAASSEDCYVPAKYLVEFSDVCGFAKHVKFCCADATGADQMVVLRAIDHAGNYNDCMVSVEVQDKLNPSITCPADTIVNCDFAFDENNLAATFGSAVVTDNCGNLTPTETHVLDLNSCRIGTLVRTFTVSNANGTGTTSCSQTIRFKAIAPFDGSQQITWPGDRTVNSCADINSPNFHPDALGYPTYNDGSCDLVGHRYTDELYVFNGPAGDNTPTNNACFKILRKWEVIDWCQYDEKTGEYAKWYRTQTIKVIDNEKPEITSSCERKSVCTYDAECKDGHIDLTATATDNCTAAMRWSYKIDANNDGSFDLGLSNSGSGNSIDASGNYPIGTHKIVYSFEDRCGNITTCEQIFDVVNCKAPTPYCIQGLAMPLMPVQDANGNVTGGMVEIWANDFDQGTAHPCGYDIIFSFEPVTRNADGTLNVVGGKTFTCDNLGINNVNMYAAVVTPMGDIVQDYCSTTIDIQNNQIDDNGDKFICPGDPGHSRITGRVATSGATNLMDVEVELRGAEVMKEMTNDNGEFAFPSMENGGSYVLAPTKDDEASNGVDTRDLIAIQRHLLNKKPITNPYDLIAADANGNGKIDPSDLFKIRKVILKLDDEFANNKDWRFVDQGYEFQNPARPLDEAFPEFYEINNLNSDMAINFVAVKVGDVNNTVNGAVESRTNATFVASDVRFNAGETVVVPVALENAADLAGFQFSLEMDSDVVEFVGLTSDVIEIGSGNVAKLTDRVATVSWNSFDETSFSANETVFNVVFTAKTAGSLADVIDLTSEVTEAAIYSLSDAQNVSLEIENRNVEAGVFMLAQNNPNPFKGMTTIQVNVPSEMVGNVTVRDITGKVVYTTTESFTTGANEIRISSDKLAASGVFYYTVNAGQFTATKRMVVIK